MESEHQVEVSQGERFEFGRNWASFLEILSDERIDEAERSLLNMLEMETLAGKRFLDIGSGSGLFSLVACRLGASVHSFDYDPQSVACAHELKQRYFPDNPNWVIEEGSILNAEYINSLGNFDVVYSWGVLHHTGNMWKALEHAVLPVAGKGKLFIAIYNDQGLASRYWKMVKQLYCSGVFGKSLMIAIYFPYWLLGGMAKDILMAKNPLTRYSEYWKQRGMSRFHDWIDWLGGYPFEVAKPEEILDFYRQRGCQLTKLKTCAGGLGCNEFVFHKSSAD